MISNSESVDWYCSEITVGSPDRLVVENGMLGLWFFFECLSVFPLLYGLVELPWWLPMA